MFNKKNYDFKRLPDFVTILKDDLNLSKVAVGLISLPAGKGYSFLHSHKEQEEVYIVIEGTGTMQINKQEISIQVGDVVRVPPEKKRALKSGKEKLIVICCGGITPIYPFNKKSNALIDDGIPHFDEEPNWYKGNEKIIGINQKLKKSYNH